MELFFSLVAGLIIAVAFQLLLANLGVALGLTVLDFSPREGESVGSTDIDLPVTHLLGVGVALSLSTVLFVAGLLTTEFSEIAQPRRGLIFGIILWATYWLLFIWLSSTTLSTIADSLLGTALASGRRLVTAICQRVGPKEPASEEQTMLRQLAEDVSALAKEQQQLPQRLAEQREALLAEINRLASTHEAPSGESQTKTAVVELEPTSSSPLASPNLMSRLNLPSGRQLLQRAIDQVDMPDISDIDVQTLWQQLRSDNTSADQNAIQLDIADYLRQLPVWMFKPDILRETFYDRVYDPEAAPEQIKAQLNKINRAHLVDWLQEREDLAAEQVETVADQINQIKDAIAAAIPSTAQTDHSSYTAALDKIQEKLIAYCRYTNLDLLTPDNLLEKVQAQLDAHGLDGDRATQLDLAAIETVLERRQGLEPTGQQALMDALRSALPDPLPQRPAPRRWAVRSGQSAQTIAKQLATQVSYYLQHQDKSALQPAQMAHDLSQLAKTSLGSLAHALPDSWPDSWFDQAAWQQALEKRRDMTADEIRQVLAGAETGWQQALQQVNAWADTSWSEVQGALKSKNDALLDAANQQITKGLSAAQHTLETQVDAVKADLQTQADAARGQVAIASWWLFSSLLLSGISAAVSGWLAVRY